MKTSINIATELSARLERGVPQHITERAVAENEWFRASDIERAVEAIRLDMLSREGLERWMSHYSTLPVTTAENILVVMAGNIPLVGFFDLLCVMMSGHRAYIKPSSKDRVLTEWIVAQILEIEPAIPIYIWGGETPDRVIATGGESAKRHFKAQYPNIPTLLRGTRHSIAVLSEGEDIADDIYAYSGLGCRNVSMIFVPKSHSLELPTAQTHTKYHNNYLQTRALLTMQDVKFTDNGASLFVESQDFPASLSTVSIFRYDSLAEVNKWIQDNDSHLQCIVSRVVSHPRTVNFGESQRPTLFDYADGVDTMKFLN